MIDGDIRKCDICGSVIPKGTTYRVARIAADKVAPLLDIPDTEMMPTLTQEFDGRVRVDICLECHISMGGIVTTQSVH